MYVRAAQGVSETPLPTRSSLLASCRGIALQGPFSAAPRHAQGVLHLCRASHPRRLAPSSVMAVRSRPAGRRKAQGGGGTTAPSPPLCGSSRSTPAAGQQIAVRSRPALPAPSPATARPHSPAALAPPRRHRGQQLAVCSRPGAPAEWGGQWGAERLRGKAEPRGQRDTGRQQKPHIHAFKFTQITCPLSPAPALDLQRNPTAAPWAMRKEGRAMPLPCDLKF